MFLRLQPIGRQKLCNPCLVHGILLLLWQRGFLVGNFASMYTSAKNNHFGISIGNMAQWYIHESCRLCLDSPATRGMTINVLEIGFAEDELVVVVGSLRGHPPRRGPSPSSLGIYFEWC